MAEKELGMELGPFTSEQVAGFLADYGYSTHPKGMAAPFWSDCESADQSLKWFDVNADAVRRRSGENGEEDFKRRMGRAFE